MAKTYDSICNKCRPLYEALDERCEELELQVTNLRREYLEMKEQRDTFKVDSELCRALVVSMAMEMFGDTFGNRK